MCRLFMPSIAVLSGLIFFAGTRLPSKPWWEIYTNGLRDRVFALNVPEHLPEIREWIDKLEKPPDGVVSQEMKLSACPPIIRKIGANFVLLNRCSQPNNGMWKVVLTSGGAFMGGWSVVFGPEDIEIPTSGIHSGYVRYVLPLGPGAYVYRVHSEG
jgi:hypothetical protein